MPMDATPSSYLLHDKAAYSWTMQYFFDVDDDAGKTEVVPGLELWNDVTQTLTDYHGYDVEVRACLVNERYEVESLKITRRPGGEAVTSPALRDLSVPAMIRHMLHASRPEGAGPSKAFGLVTPEAAIEVKNAGPVDTSLVRVAGIYRSANAVQYPPTKAVQETFNLPARTAGSWISKARAKGYLPEVDTRSQEVTEVKNGHDGLGNGQFAVIERFAQQPYTTHERGEEDFESGAFDAPVRSSQAGRGNDA